MNVYQLRLSLGLTQDGLAARLGCHSSTVSRWERGGHVSKFYQKELLRLKADLQSRSLAKANA